MPLFVQVLLQIRNDQKNCVCLVSRVALKGMRHDNKTVELAGSLWKRAEAKG